MGGMDGGLAEMTDEQIRLEHYYTSLGSSPLSEVDNLIEGVNKLEAAISEGKALRFGSLAVIGTEVSADCVSQLTGNKHVRSGRALIGAVLLTGEKTEFKTVGGSELLSGFIRDASLNGRIELRESHIENSTLIDSILINSSIHYSKIERSKLKDVSATDSSLRFCEIRSSSLNNARFSYIKGCAGATQLSGDMSDVYLAHTEAGQVITSQKH